MTASPDRQFPWGLLHSIGLLVAYLVMGLCFYLFTMEKIPHYSKMFQDMALPLPWLTLRLLDGSFYYPLYALMALAIGKEAVIKNRPISATINWFLIWTIPIYSYIFAEALYSPLLMVIQQLN